MIGSPATAAAAKGVGLIDDVSWLQTPYVIIIDALDDFRGSHRSCRYHETSRCSNV